MPITRQSQAILDWLGYTKYSGYIGLYECSCHGLIHFHVCFYEDHGEPMLLTALYARANEGDSVPFSQHSTYFSLPCCDDLATFIMEVKGSDWILDRIKNEPWDPEPQVNDRIFR